MKKKKKHNKYPLMGKKVLVKSIYIKKINDWPENKNIVTWEYKKLNPFKIGWVAGYRKRFEGNIMKGSYIDDYHGYELPYFVPTKTISCLMVAFSPLINPVPVPLDEVMELPKGVINE